ncbi:MAG: pectin methylesterase [Lachnospiraceae bacterium]|nr:pectin methylesterase [Lachnospiraceae bacterium]
MQTIISTSDLTIENEYFTGDIGALSIHPDGRPYGTFRTSTVLAEGARIHFMNCVFENTAGPGKEAGQAIALYLDGDDIRLTDCILRGHQDTLFLAPLPEKEVIKDGFLGPKQYTQRTHRSFLFKGCRIEGGVDFIFGGATAVFEECEFVNVEPGYVFAPCTPKEIDRGFLAKGCKFLCTDNVMPKSCYIARPWRQYGKVRLEDCYLGEHMHPEGFADWSGRGEGGTVVFEEYGSFGPGASGAKRPAWVRSGADPKNCFISNASPVVKNYK